MGTLRTHPWDFHWDQSHTSEVTGDGAEGDPSPFPTPRTMRPLQGGAEPGYTPGQQGGQTDRVPAPPCGSLHPQQNGSQDRQRIQASRHSDPPVPPKPHHQKLEQCRRVPVACGIEEQHTHLRTTAGRKGRWPIPPGDLQHHHHTPTMCAPFASSPYSWGLSWLRAACWNQWTQAWMLLVV